MPKLDREQLKIINAINREARYLPRGLQRKFKLAAYETGLVESGLRNLPGGDADSAGWRQERASLYKNPTNVNASARRFRQEFQQHYDPGERAGDVAAQVQRPAAQYAGRYQAAKPQAVQILRQYGSGQGGAQIGGGLPPSYQTTTSSTPGVDNSALRQQAKLAYLDQRGNPDALLQLASTLRGAQDIPGSTVTRTKKLGGSAGSAGSAHGSVGNDAVAIMKQAAEKIDQAKVPYQWGGGHSGKQKRFGPVTALDCSGAVSRVLGIDPMVSGQLASWGKAGKGKRVTIYANGEHTLMEIDGHVFGTSAQNKGGGAGWIPKSYFPKGYFKNFAVRHPPGM